MGIAVNKLRRGGKYLAVGEQLDAERIVGLVLHGNFFREGDGCCHGGGLVKHFSLSVILIILTQGNEIGNGLSGKNNAILGVYSEV
jgi:hypothetical protein